jgi:hypothetical protein
MNYIYVCSDSTRDEVFDKRLFGDKEKFKKPVEQDDKLFLLDKDKELIIGPFLAETAMEKNIDKDAFGGRFPYQVRVDWDKLHTIPRNELDKQLKPTRPINESDALEIIFQLIQDGEQWSPKQDTLASYISSISRR